MAEWTEKLLPLRLRLDLTLRAWRRLIREPRAWSRRRNREVEEGLERERKGEFVKMTSFESRIRVLRKMEDQTMGFVFLF